MDYRRWEWQYWANRWATWVMCFCIFLMADEVYWAIKYHWPLWDEIAMPLTAIVGVMAWLVKYHTEMYRWDV